eukprot:GHVT01053237.1.p1 GENE.GHVT01053237.1~~GHVT01053237.1.p1  ORF type:complete len:527 (+),score=111.34 GHVT01053237.1:90-1670(+)
MSAWVYLISGSVFFVWGVCGCVASNCVPLCVAVCWFALQFVHDEMKAYRLYTVVPKLLSFLDQLTNWYVRFNRDRMRGSLGAGEATTSLGTLYDVLLSITRLMAPYTPFTAETIYTNLRRALPAASTQRDESIHFMMMPEARADEIDEVIERQFERMEAVILLGRVMRERQKVSLKRPVRRLLCLHADEEYLNDVRAVKAYIHDELNVLDVELSNDMALVNLRATLNFRNVGPRLGKKLTLVQAAVAELSQEALASFERDGSLEVCGEILQADDLRLHRMHGGVDDPNIQIDGNNSVVVLMDFTADENLNRMALAREIANRVQKYRKAMNLSQDAAVDMWASSEDCCVEAALNEESEYLFKCLRRTLYRASDMQSHMELLGSQVFDIALPPAIGDDGPQAAGATNKKQNPKKETQKTPMGNEEETAQANGPVVHVKIFFTQRNLVFNRNEIAATLSASGSSDVDASQIDEACTQVLTLPAIELQKPGLPHMVTLAACPRPVSMELGRHFAMSAATAHWLSGKSECA